jgi:hypothetical protein
MIRYFAGNKYYFDIQTNEKEYKNYKYWCIVYYNENNKYHRLDGPALEYSKGDKEWYKNGLRHRKDGPAIEYSNDEKYYYYYNGKQIYVKTDKEFKQYLKMKVFI